ncbi:MAG: flagellar basal body P-ring formation chaperone FlgA [Pseudomonadota bacterium]
MKWACAFLMLLLSVAQVAADTVIAIRTIRAREVIMPADLRVDPAHVPGTLSDPVHAIGQEARYTIYAGRPVRLNDLVTAAVVERNELVLLFYRQGALSIRADGRSLGRGAVGDRVRVMNLASRATVTGTVVAPGQISVP